MWPGSRNPSLYISPASTPTEYHHGSQSCIHVRRHRRRPRHQPVDVTTPGVELLTVAVNDYAQAEDVASKLADEGYVAIELCGGFGIEGVARVKKAVPDTVAVGVVRFDHHPGLGHKSGDELY